jgi:hypothetical protein
LSRLQPGVEKVARAAADPELRDVAANAIAILEKVAKEGQEAAAQPEAAKAEPEVSRGVHWGGALVVLSGT